MISLWFSGDAVSNMQNLTRDNNGWCEKSIYTDPCD